MGEEAGTEVVMAGTGEAAGVCQQLLEVQSSMTCLIRFLCIHNPIQFTYRHLYILNLRYMYRLHLPMPQAPLFKHQCGISVRVLMRIIHM